MANSATQIVNWKISNPLTANWQPPRCKLNIIILGILLYKRTETYSLQTGTIIPRYWTYTSILNRNLKSILSTHFILKSELTLAHCKLHSTILTANTFQMYLLQTENLLTANWTPSYSQAWLNYQTCLLQTENPRPLLTVQAETWTEFYHSKLKNKFILQNTGSSS